MNHNDTTVKDERRLLSKNMYLSLYCKTSKRVIQGLRVRGSWRPNKDCNILTPTLVAVSVASFSFSRVAQPEAQRPSSLLGDGFLYCILSATFLDPNSSGVPRAPSAGLSLPHLISNLSGPQLNRGPLQPGVAFPTTSLL